MIGLMLLSCLMIIVLFESKKNRSEIINLSTFLFYFILSLLMSYASSKHGSDFSHIVPLWIILLIEIYKTGNLEFKKNKLLDVIFSFRKTLFLFFPVFFMSISIQSYGSAYKWYYLIEGNAANEIKKIRQIIPKNFLLIPGVGAQGGDLISVSKIAMNLECGILINCSRSIIYSSTGFDFAEKASFEAKKIQQKMSSLLLEMIR